MTRTTPEDFVYVFNHLPRTAGGAVAELLGQSRSIEPDYPGATEELRDAWLRQPLPLDKLAPGTVLMGHFTAPGGRLHERYPQVFESPRYRLITFLREPIAWVESSLRYFGYGNLGYASVDEAVQELAGTYARAYDCRRLSPERAMAHYWFVGLCEHAQRDCDRLLERLGATPGRLPDIHRTDLSSACVLDSRQRQRYRALAPLDFALFDVARMRAHSACELRS